MVALGVALDTSSNLGRTVTGRVLRPMLCVDRDRLDLTTIGREMDLQAWLKNKKRSQRLNAETVRIADALERVGYEAYRQDQTELRRVCGVTLAEETIGRSFRHIKILPAVQVADTAAYRRELFAFMAGHDVKAQMVVFGQGWCRPEELRQRICDLSRKISKIASKLRKVWGADLFFRNIEMTYHRDPSNGLMIHVHSHGFLDHPFYPNEIYKKFRDFVNNISPKSINGKGYANLSYIDKNKLHEVVKYPFKPQKSKDRNLTDEEWLIIAQQTERLKFFAPLGGFRTWRADLRPSGQPERKLVVVDGPDGPIVYAKPGIKTGKREPSASVSSDVIVNLLRPSPRFSPRATPAIMISNRSAEPLDRVLRQAGCGSLIDGWRAIYNARVYPYDRLPLFDPRSLAEAVQRGWRIEIEAGATYAICEATERFEAGKATAQAAIVMQHNTTATVPGAVVHSRSKGRITPVRARGAVARTPP